MRKKSRPRSPAFGPRVLGHSPEASGSPAVPSFARELVSLDGDWDFRKDPDNRGKVARWFARFPRQREEIQVPSVWERLYPGYDGVGWYRRTFDLPEGWEGCSLRLRFHAVQYFCEVWLNGKFVGRHEGGFLPFEFVITPQARLRKNELVVRVINPPMDSAIEGFRCGAPLNQSTIPIGKAGWYFNFGGLWQSVEIQATRDVTLAAVALVPRPTLGRVKITLEIENDGPAKDFELTCAFRECGSNGTPVGERRRRRRLQPGRNVVRWEQEFPSFKLWSPARPVLYSAELSIGTAGRLCDRISQRFGMREFGFDAGRFVLNGEPITLMGFLHQGAYPRTLVGPEDRALAERELRQLKEKGFNFVRAHLLPALPMWLEVADEIGLLVMAEPPIGWIENSPQTEARCWREIAGLVARDHCHPSVVMWGLMNEVFHLKGFTPEDVRAMTLRWAQRLRDLDPTRPIIDVSGGHGLIEAGGAADMLPDTTKQRLTARLFGPGRRGPVEVMDAHIYHAYPVADEVWRRMRTVGREGDFLFVSEFGAPPVPPDFEAVLSRYSAEERARGLEDWRLHRDFADSLNSIWAASPSLRQAFGRRPARWIEACNRVRADEVRLLVTALRSNPALAGFCFCQLADASGEFFGAFDFWRRPKPLFAALAEAADPRAVGIFAWPRAVAAGDQVNIELAGLTGAAPASAAKRWQLELRDGEGRSLRSWRGIRLRSSAGKGIWRKTIAAPGTPGSYSLQLTEQLPGAGKWSGRISLQVVAGPGQSLRGLEVGACAPRILTRLRREGASGLPFGNNYREAWAPVLLDMTEVAPNRVIVTELFGQLRKVLQAGGAAVLFEPEMAVLQDLLLSAPIRMQPLMHATPYTTAHPVLAGLPQKAVADFTYANVLPDKYDSAADVVAQGGSVIVGALAFHMWTRPACFFHGAAVYSLPIGRGTLVVCQLKILSRLGQEPVADQLFRNLVTFAHRSIRLGSTAALLARCIDPTPQPRPHA